MCCFSRCFFQMSCHTCPLHALWESPILSASKSPKWNDKNIVFNYYPEWHLCCLIWHYFLKWYCSGSGEWRDHERQKDRDLWNNCVLVVKRNQCWLSIGNGKTWTSCSSFFAPEGQESWFLWPLKRFVTQHKNIHVWTVITFGHFAYEELTKLTSWLCLLCVCVQASLPCPFSISIIHQLLCDDDLASGGEGPMFWELPLSPADIWITDIWA